MWMFFVSLTTKTRCGKIIVENIIVKIPLNYIVEFDIKFLCDSM